MSRVRGETTRFHSLKHVKHVKVLVPLQPDDNRTCHVITCWVCCLPLSSTHVAQTFLPVCSIPEPDSPPKSVWASSGESALVPIRPRRQRVHLRQQQNIFSHREEMRASLGAGEGVRVYVCAPLPPAAASSPRGTRPLMCYQPIKSYPHPTPKSPLGSMCRQSNDLKSTIVKHLIVIIL